MLGAPEQRQVVLNWIYDVLDRRVDGRDRSYSFKVKYNAARALERLHSEGHLRHWQWIRDYSRLKNPERYLVHGWAVRGFQRKELGFGHRPPIHVASRASRDEEQGRFSRLLIQKIHELSEFAELSQDASYLLVNLTHALIRWYEPSEVDDKRLSRLANDNSYLNDHAKQNLDLALWWWCHKRRKKVVVERTTDKRRRITHIGQHARSAS
jgi:hypothetical protein